MIQLNRPSRLPLLAVLLALCIAGGLLASPALPAHAQSDEAPLVSFEPASTRVFEGTQAAFTLTRTGSTAGTLTVIVSTVEPNHPEATSSSNPTFRDHEVSFDAGSQTATFSVVVTDDGVTESDDWLEAEISPSDDSSYRLGEPRRVTVTIGDPLVVVTITASQETVTEGAELTFTLTRSGSTAGALTVKVSISDPGAFLRGNHRDPEPDLPAWVQFAAGSRTETITLQTKDDRRDIPDNDVTVTILDSDDYEAGLGGSAAVTVMDNDIAPVLELSFDKTTLEEGETLTITLQRRGVALVLGDVHNQLEVDLSLGFQGQPYTIRLFLSGFAETKVTIPVVTDDDDLDAPDRTYTATLRPYPSQALADVESEYLTVQGPRTRTATVRDNDKPEVSVEALRSSYSEGKIGKIRLRRTGNTTEELMVSVVVTQSPGATDQLWTKLPELRTFRPGVTELVSNYALTEDGIDEHDGHVTLAIQPGDDYEVDPEAATATFTVVDTDPLPVLSFTDASASEDDGTIDFAVTLTPRSGKTVRAAFFTSNVTAKGTLSTSGVSVNDPDYTTQEGMVVIEPGQTSFTLTIPMKDDNVAEEDETFTISYGIAWEDDLRFFFLEPANTVLPDGQESVVVTGTIVDDEPVVSIAASDPDITEGHPAVFTLSRTGAAADEMMVRLAVFVSGSQSTDEYPMVTFPAGDSTATHEVPTEDDHRHGPTTVVSALLLSPAALKVPNTYRVSGTAAYVNVADNDLPSVTITAGGPGKEGAPAVFTLERDGDVTDELTVNVNVTAAEGFVSGTPPTSVVFEEGESAATLSIPTVGDNTVEDSSSVTVAVGTGSGYQIGDPGSATFLVLDDDGLAPLVTVSAEESVVFEGEDIVFVFTRTGVGIDRELTAYVNVHKKAYENLFHHPVTSTAHEVVFDANSTTATLIYPTVDDPGNNGNHSVKARLNLGQYTFQSPSHEVEVWVRDDDVATVTMTPEFREQVEDGDSVEYTTVRTGDTTYQMGVRWLTYWDEHVPDELLDPIGLLLAAEHRDPRRNEVGFFFSPGDRTATTTHFPRDTSPFGTTAYAEVLPRYCGDDVPGDCGYYPQYVVGTPNSTTIELLNNDVGVRVVADQESVTEGEAASFTLHRYGGRRDARAVPLTVRVQVTQNGEFIEGMPAQTVTFGGTPTAELDGGQPEGELSATVSIPTTDDMLDEDDGAITLTILTSNPSLTPVNEHSYEIFGTETYLADSGYTNVATVTVTDNDLAAVSIADAFAEEDAGAIEFTVTAVPSTSAISVDWETKQGRVVDDHAIPGEDYVEASGSLTFAPGETTKTISVTLLDDDLSEPDETFSVILSNPSGASLNDPEATGTIENDDAKQVILPLEGADHGPVVEGQNVVFQLERFSWVLGFITIQEEPRGRLVMEAVVTQEGEFISGSAPTTVVFEEGEWTTTVVVPTVDDDVFEAPGSVSLGIADLGWNVRTFLNPIEVTVWDNDMPVSIGDDQEVEEDAGEITFTVSLEEPAVRPVTVYATTVDGDPTSNGAVSQENLGRDFEARSEWLTFEEGEQTKQFTVTVLDDTYDEATSETFTVELRNPTNGRLLDGSATGRIIDNDQRMNVVLIPPAYKRHDEDSGPVTFYLELVHERTSFTGRETSVDWSVTAGTATHGEDYVEASGTAVIPAGYVTGTFKVTVVDDDLFEEKFETFTVELTGARGLGLVDSQKSVEINIRDNERLSATVTADAVSVSEGEDAVFTVSLEGGRTTGPTVITYDVEGTAAAADYTAPNGTLTISAGDRTGSITIPTLTDTVVDPDETLVVELTDAMSSGRAVRTRGNPATATILDPGTLSASVAGGEATEGGPVTFTVTLSAAAAPVQVQWRTADASPDDTATVGVDYQTTNGTVTIHRETPPPPSPSPRFRTRYLRARSSSG